MVCLITGSLQLTAIIKVGVTVCLQVVTFFTIYLGAGCIYQQSDAPLFIITYNPFYSFINWIRNDYQSLLSFNSVLYRVKGRSLPLT